MVDIEIEYAVQFLHSWLELRFRELNLPGFSVTVLKEDNIIFSQAYGLADVTMRVPLQPSHLFAVGSQSKMVTAMAILLLSEQSKLRLDDHIGEYLPWITKHEDPLYQTLTIRQLLMHSAGISRDGSLSGSWFNGQLFPNRREFRQAVLDSHRVLEPYERMKYSNFGYALLGQIAEAASGQSYDSYATKYIIRPMTSDMYVDWNPRLESRIAMGYAAPLQQLRCPTPPTTATKTLAPAIGLLASTEALCRFAMSQFSNNASILTDDALKREAQHSHWTLTDGYDAGFEYGLGFEVIRVADWRLLGHGGSMPGYRTATFLETQRKFAVSVAVNCKDAPVMAMIRGIFSVLQHFARTAKAPTPKRLERFNASLWSPLSYVQVVATKGAIKAIDPNSWEPFAWSESLTPTGKNTLRIVTPNSIHSIGETVHYNFRTDKLVNVNYSGLVTEPIPRHTPSSEPEKWLSASTATSYTLPSQAADTLLIQELMYDKHHLFIFEVLPEYEQTEYMGLAQSYSEWRRGNINRSMALMESTWADPHRPKWMNLYTSMRSITRIRIIDDEQEVPFTKWEKEQFRRINVPSGEKIYYVSRKLLRGITIPAGDMTLVDNKWALINHYNKGLYTHRTVYHSSNLEFERFLRLRRQLMQQITQHRLQLFAS